MEVIVKKDISHYNRALQKKITNRYQYSDEMKRQGMVSQEKGDYLAKRAEESKKQPYKVSKDTMGFLMHMKAKSKNGKITPRGNEIKYMQKMGVNFKRPEDKGTQGGMYSE